jgi:hypothetical protein
MSNETIFFILGPLLAVSAVTVSLVGLRVKSFPGKAMPLVILWFVILIGGTTTFGVLHSQEEQKADHAEYVKAGKKLELEEHQ